jgi:hypothetical protein
MRIPTKKHTSRRTTGLFQFAPLDFGLSKDRACLCDDKAAHKDLRLLDIRTGSIEATDVNSPLSAT